MIETERAVLGSCLMRPSLLPAVRALINREHFASPPHALIFAAACHLADEGHFDAIALTARLRQISHLNSVGGENYLLSLCESDVGELGVEFHARELYRHWLRRQYVALGKNAEEGTELDELRFRAEALIKNPMPRQTPAVLGRVGTFGEKDRVGLPTGYECVNRHLTTQGWPSGQMCIVAAYHKMGKSSFQISCAIRAAQAGRKPLYATFADMGGQDIEERAMRHESKFSRRPKTEDYHRQWDEALRKFQEEWHIDVYDAAGLDTGYDVETFVVWLESRVGSEGYTEVYVDYAQELRSRDRKANNDLSEASICASLIQRTARRLDIPIIVGSQITEGRNGERDKTKGSRVWEEKAGLVLRLKREEDGNDATLEIPFNRFGPRGHAQLHWNSERVRFEEVGR